MLKNENNAQITNECRESIKELYEKLNQNKQTNCYDQDLHLTVLQFIKKSIDLVIYDSTRDRTIKDLRLQVQELQNGKIMPTVQRPVYQFNIN